MFNDVTVDHLVLLVTGGLVPIIAGVLAMINESAKVYRPPPTATPAVRLAAMDAKLDRLALDVALLAKSVNAALGALEAAAHHRARGRSPPD